ncbi:MAG: hypothetical protein AAGF92_04655 [Myxococcota bacterium]
MNDLELFMSGAMVSMIAFAGAYINVRRRANSDPVDSYVPNSRVPAPEPVTQSHPLSMKS